MPQAELKFSSDLNLNAQDILAKVETIICDHDSGAGDCKGRAFPVDHYHHTHILLEVLVLEKAHRDDVFMAELLKKLTDFLDTQLPKGCARAISVGFLPKHYVTGQV